MPDAQTTRRAKADLRAGKKASTAAGEFVKTEMEHIRQGKHGARNTKQAIAIGLSEARRAGVPVGDNPNRRSARSGKRKSAPRAKASKAPSRKRSAAARKALKREPRAAASKRNLSRQARGSARRRGLKVHAK